MKKTLTVLLFFVVLFGVLPFPAGGEVSTIEFFYSEVCPHCAAEKEFLRKLESERPELDVKFHVVNKKKSQEKLKELYKEYDVDVRKRGLVPTTFVGEYCFVGFDGPEGAGNKIKQALKGTFKGEDGCSESGDKTVRLALIGEIDIGKYSLPVLTVLMGLLDGFNVCSLGALVLVLGLVLGLKSRSKILLYGGIFMLVTAVVYGALIVAWYKLFSLLSTWLRAMEIVIGLLAVGGGVHFLKEFIRFKKEGPTCESAGKKMGGRFLDKVRQSISEEGGAKPLALAGSILLFAVVIAVVEFPCSAAVPVVYAGILADANLPAVAHLLYIAAFTIFYLLDEIIVFLVAVWKMSVWISSPKFVTWVTLVESIVLFGLGALYLVGI